MKPIIYLDMDGVLADFDSGAKELVGTSWRTEIVKPNWGKLGEYPSLFSLLTPMENAKELFLKCCEITEDIDRVQILTALPNKVIITHAVEDKINWAHRYIHPEIKVNFGPYAQDKQNYVKHSEDMLIDDMEININQWRNKGGKGILHFSVEETLKFLEKEWYDDRRII